MFCHCSERKYKTKIYEMNYQANKLVHKPCNCNNSVYICVASSQNSPLVGRNESGIIHDLSKNYFLNLNFSLFCLLFSILINIVF